MDSRENVANCEKLDQATKLLMASLEQTKALNSQIRNALQYMEQANAIEQSGHSADVFELLELIARNFK
jgi:hypothetical protein